MNKNFHHSLSSFSYFCWKLNGGGVEVYIKYSCCNAYIEILDAIFFWLCFSFFVTGFMQTKRLFKINE